MNEDTLL
jgi:hypothetical protein